MNDNYEWLARLRPNSLLLELNEHACNYVTANEWIDSYSPDEFKDVPAPLIAGMKATNTIWRLQIYPNTPVGCDVWYGPTLDSVIEQARADYLHAWLIK